MEMEKENNINLLNISILRNNESFEFKIYRKPTTTDTIIPSDSNHPPEQKLSTIRFLVNRLHSYPITDIHRQQEYNTICHILHANTYHLAIVNGLSSQIQTTVRKTNSHSHALTQSLHDVSQNMLQSKTPQRFATFTYIGKETRFVTKVFKHINLLIAYRT